MSPETFTIFGITMTVTDAVQFHYMAPPFTLLHRKQLKEFLNQLLQKEGQTAEAINIIFCTDDYLLTINQQYLQHDTYTDVITFQHSAKGAALVADIYISVDRVRENAVTYKTSFKKELHRVLFHGLLHICGYQDKSPSATTRMRIKEEFYLSHYFVPRENGTID